MTLSLIMDVVVLFALAAMIGFSFRLSYNLSVFKKSREDLALLIGELSQHIEKAYGAIDTLKSATSQNTDDLQETMSEARYLIDELQLMNSAADSLAQRLEVASNAGRAKAGAAPVDPPLPNKSSAKEQDTANWQDTLKKQKGTADEGVSPFAIRDKEFEASDVTDIQTRGAKSQAYQSQAEKDLMEALQKNKKA